MKSIRMTDGTAKILAAGDGSVSDPICRELRCQAQVLADETGDTVEILHPDGYVWDARMAMENKEESI